ncbi:nucleoside deaminase [Hymenobacter setariae]|uniref:Nucleoside deaminase n=1 Tax=Hymenobacter setariae TaxID=2594794 RepID=A0A558BRN7_9BACT|nr:nucleoside deaminase [Hymenobacter setariae]TVT39180.1 nucleoside deaminase [Hymenobacter setariae]
MPQPLTPTDLPYLRRCLALAAEALQAGDEPFGSILVDAQGQVLAEARNQVNDLNALAHPELALAQWAATHLESAARAATTLYTSGEHCPMCAAAHGWVGLGKIVYLSSAEQLTKWLQEIGAPPSLVQMLPIQTVVRGVEVAGPADGELLQAIKDLQVSYHTTALNEQRSK